MNIHTDIAAYDAGNPVSDGFQAMLDNIPAEDLVATIDALRNSLSTYNTTKQHLKRIQ